MVPPPLLLHMQDMSTCNIMILMLRLIYVRLQFRAIIITYISHSILSLILQVGAKVCHHYIVQEVGIDMRIERSNMKYCITICEGWICLATCCTTHKLKFLSDQ